MLSVNEPAPIAGVGSSSMSAIPIFAATATAGLVEPFSTTKALAFKSFK
jgi:hypothetical protein